MGLRLAEGVDLGEVARETGLRPDQIIDGDAAAAFIEHGLVERTADRIRITPEGRLLLNSITARLIADRPLP